MGNETVALNVNERSPLCSNSDDFNLCSICVFVCVVRPDDDEETCAMWKKIFQGIYGGEYGCIWALSSYIVGLRALWGGIGEGGE